MLVVNDRRLLGDGNLDFLESMDRYARNTEALKTENFKLWDHDILINVRRRSGQRMHSSEFIQRVQKLNPTIFVQQQINFPDEWGLYTDVRGKLTLLSPISKGSLPEFSYLLLDRQELVDGQRIGWRAGLVRLLQWGALSWAQVQQEFGDCEGANAYRWRKDTAIYRRDDCVLRINEKKSIKVA